MTSRTTKCIVLLILVAGKVGCHEEFSFSDDEEDDNRPHVDSRFFNIGGIINQLFPGLGQVGHDGPYDAGESGHPGHNHFYPGSNFQGPSNHRPADNWPIIDDASQYPSKGHNTGNPQQTLMPPQSGFNPQPQYPNQWDMGSPKQPHYPSDGNIANPQGRPNTNLGGGMQYPDQGGENQFPQGNQPYPDQGMGPQYPNEGDLGIPSQFPSQGGSQEGQFPNQEGLDKRPNNDGTLYSMTPPDPGIGDPSDNGSENNGRDPTAILGRPVVVPPSNTPEGQIFFPNSTESPSQRQCVQDCQSSSEYNPVCGSNNVTYFNPGKFVCARNCGINVFVSGRGRCRNDS